VAERAANNARRQAIVEHEKSPSSPEVAESSLDIGVCTTHRRSRGMCGPYTPGNLISIIATSAAVASAAATAAEWDENVAIVLGTAGAPAASCAASAADWAGNARKAPRLTSISAALRWVECKSTLVRQNSNSLPMSLRLQRFDSVEQAHARFAGKPPLHQHHFGALPLTSTLG